MLFLKSISSPIKLSEKSNYILINIDKNENIVFNVN
jgi:hypothetical protein